MLKNVMGYYSKVELPPGSGGESVLMLGLLMKIVI